ncbi:hypothetical protein EV696_11950 [Permianibacter aggregans]|uniref:Uncharacterized protein n=1 Tax=Permianibacter aggregans TaxID=1510150 RepID=A0A4R6UGY4_9GAMM|nr:hypothetical protein EV696_11950 [Permianibacter aggregans]
MSLPERLGRSSKTYLAHWGALLFEYFLLREQEKVLRPPGRDPAKVVIEKTSKF